MARKGLGMAATTCREWQHTEHRWPSSFTPGIFLVGTQKAKWWISCVNVGEGHFFFSSFSLPLSQSEKRGGFETLPSLLHRAAEEGGKKKGKKKKAELALIAVITLQLCNSDICPSLKNIHLYHLNHLHSPQNCWLRVWHLHQTKISPSHAGDTHFITGMRCIWIGERV